MKIADRICVGMTGSPRAYEVLSFIRTLRSQYCDEVAVLMSDEAARMLPPEMVRLAANEVETGWCSPHYAAPHVELPMRSDIFAVLPATANTICKAAVGICDTNVLAAVSVSSKPVIFAPAMNANSWASGPVRGAVAQLRADGHLVVDPSGGFSVTEERQDGGMISADSEVLAMLQHFAAQRRIHS